MLKPPDGYEYWYIDDETEKWCIKEDAPNWAKKEFEEFFRMIKGSPDKNGVILRCQVIQGGDKQ